jgi:succinate dehydrogenase / fumarate reductase cytochrome b subunit
MVWGISRLFQSKINSLKTDGASPSLGRYGRNHAYTWQRLTSWILLVGIISHVVQMRFVNQPQEIRIEGKHRWVAEVRFDEGLSSLSRRLGVEIKPALGEMEPMRAGALVAAIAPDMGTATLLVVRDAFKSPLQSFLYSIFVLAAAFHAFNGFWTFLITWGVLLSYRSQRAMIPASIVGIGVLSFLGLASIWGSYWINLRQ